MTAGVEMRLCGCDEQCARVPAWRRNYTTNLGHTLILPPHRTQRLLQCYSGIMYLNQGLRLGSGSLLFHGQGSRLSAQRIPTKVAQDHKRRTAFESTTVSEAVQLSY